MSEDHRPSERPRLQLKPRDPDAAQAYAAQRARACSKPFGAAKPREQVIAERLGKTEEEVLKEAVKKERPNLRLNAEQFEQQRQAEARIEDVRFQLGASDSADRSALEAELATRESELKALLDKFEALALEAALRGGIQRPSERHHHQQQQGYGDAEGGRPGRREGHGGVGYGDSGRGMYERHGRGHFEREGSGGRGGHGEESRDYGRSRGGYDREGDVYSRGDGGPKGGRGAHERAEGGGAVYERAPREGRCDRDVGRGGEREGGRGRGGHDRTDGNFDCMARGGRSGGGWVAGGDRGSYNNVSGEGSYDRRRRGGDYDDGIRSGFSVGMGECSLGGCDGRGGYSSRGGGRGYEQVYEDFASTDYVSPYQNIQDRF